MASPDNMASPTSSQPDPLAHPEGLDPASGDAGFLQLKFGAPIASTLGDEGNPASKASGSKAGLAPLLMTVVELIRQLMEAQIVRRMEANRLSPQEIERAGQSLQGLRDQILQICQILEIDPADLNISLGELGTLLPRDGSYYPGYPSPQASVLELLDRLITTGIVIDAEIDLGVAQLDLVHARLKMVLTSDSKLL